MDIAAVPLDRTIHHNFFYSQFQLSTPMNKKIGGGIGAAIAIAIIVGIIYSVNLEPQPDVSIQVTKHEKLGLVINTPDSSTNLQQLDEIYTTASQSGIGRSNVYMFWNIVEPEKNQYNWNQYDVLMSMNKKNNLEVTLYFSVINAKTLGPFPAWIGKPSLNSISEDNLVKVLDAILSRYDIIDSVILAGETDEHFRYNEVNIPVYTELFNNVYDKIKEKHPDVKIGNAFSLHGVLNKNLQHIVQELSLGDFVAFSYFPVDSLNEITKSPRNYDDLEKIFEIVPDKQIGIFELSWSSSEFVGGSVPDQTDFIASVFPFYSNNESKIEFFTWYRLYDRPQGTCYIDVEEPEGSVSVGGASGLGSSEYVAERLGHYICSAGLIESDGTPQTGWTEFKRQVEFLNT